MDWKPKIFPIWLLKKKKSLLFSGASKHHLYSISSFSSENKRVPLKVLEQQYTSHFNTEQRVFEDY